MHPYSYVKFGTFFCTTWYTKTPYFGGLWSFKVIDVDTIKKLVTNVCYDEQYICAVLQLFSC